MAAVRGTGRPCRTTDEGASACAPIQSSACGTGEGGVPKNSASAEREPQA